MELASHLLKNAEAVSFLRPEGGFISRSVKKASSGGGRNRLPSTRKAADSGTSRILLRDGGTALDSKLRQSPTSPAQSVQCRYWRDSTKPEGIGPFKRMPEAHEELGKSPAGVCDILSFDVQHPFSRAVVANGGDPNPRLIRRLDDGFPDLGEWILRWRTRFRFTTRERQTFASGLHEPAAPSL